MIGVLLNIGVIGLMGLQGSNALNTDVKNEFKPYISLDIKQVNIEMENSVINGEVKETYANAKYNFNDNISTGVFIKNRSVGEFGGNSQGIFVKLNYSFGEK